MPIDKATAIKIATLARLDLGTGLNESQKEAALSSIVSEFNKIVNYMDILSEVDTEGVAPLYSPMINPALPREDCPRPPDSSETDLILDSAPDRIGRFFSVPRIF